LRVRVAVWYARRYAGIEVYFEGDGWAAAARRIYGAARALLEQRSQAWREALSAPRLGVEYRGLLRRYESGEVDWLPPVRLRNALALEVGVRTAVVAERHVIEELEGAVLEIIREHLPEAEVEVVHLAGRARRPLTRMILKPADPLPAPRGGGGHRGRAGEGDFREGAGPPPRRAGVAKG